MAPPTLIVQIFAAASKHHHVKCLFNKFSHKLVFFFFTSGENILKIFLVAQIHAQIQEIVFGILDRRTFYHVKGFPRLYSLIY